MKSLKAVAQLERLVWADVLRVVAIYLVLVVHASTMPSSAFPLSNSWPYIISFSIAKICVPLFVMLSGALLLEKKETYKMFFKKRILKVLTPWIVWTAIYMGINYYTRDFQPQTFSEWKYYFTLTFFTELWFLPLIFSIYLLTPIIRLTIPLLKKTDKIYIIILWFVWVSILPFFNSSPAFPKPFNSGLLSLAVYFSGYFLLGHFLTKIKYPKNTLWFSSVLIILGILINFVSLFLVNENELVQYQSSIFDYIAPDEWGSNSIVISKYGARITVASTEQSIRGLRHGEYRPDLVICDDVEDLNSVKTREGRDKTFQWLVGEVLPIGDQGTKIVIVGNLLHEDSLLMRLKQGIENQKLNGKFFAYPLLGKDNEIAWKDKFPSQIDVEKLRSSIGTDSAWYREYLLRIISDAERLVHPEWIAYYDKSPSERANGFRFIATGVDLAISQKDSADFTAMVSAKIFGQKDDLRVYILPFPINKRLSFPETFEQAKNLSENLGNGLYTMLYIEDVGYQQSLIQHLQGNNIPAVGVKVSGQDKRARLALITHLIKQGKILFPKKGAEELIQQLTGFSIEKHDDLADAFSLLILKIQEMDNKPTFDYSFI